MRYLKSDRPLAASFVVAALGVALAGATLLNPVGAHVARAQTEPVTAANGVLLPPADFDPVAARNLELTESAIDPATSTAPVAPPEESTAAEAPGAGVEAPETGSDGAAAGAPVTTSLGGSDVAVSSVGGSYEVDGPNKRSERKK